MVYAATTGVIIYWEPNHPFVIYIDHYVWFDEYNSLFNIEFKLTSDFLLLQQDPENILHNLDLLKLILY